MNRTDTPTAPGASGMKLSKEEFQRLATLDTCSVSNAIERFRVRMRNEGFARAPLKCWFPRLGPMLGYAATGRIRTDEPPMTGCCYYDRMDWWTYLASLPGPTVMVLEDIDDTPGLGAFVGEIHANIGSALGCAGYVTNGAVRDLPQVDALGFHLFSASAAVSHSYAHLIEFGQPVEIGGLKIRSGDLIHGDRHGIQIIPPEIAAGIPAEVEKLETEERELIQYCQSARFSLEGLAKLLERGRKDVVDR